MRISRSSLIAHASKRIAAVVVTESAVSQVRATQRPFTLPSSSSMTLRALLSRCAPHRDQDMPVNRQLTVQWQAEHAAFLERDLSKLDHV